jgi:hypothetical protein
MPLKSKTSIARPKSKSLRATIPEGIVEFLNLQPGDGLEWSMETAQGERAVTIKKSEKLKLIQKKSITVHLARTCLG